MWRTGTRLDARGTASAIIGTLALMMAYTDAVGQEGIANDSVHLYRYVGVDQRLPWSAVELWRVGDTLQSSAVVEFESTLQPWDVATDSSGSVYIADRTQVYVVSSDGRSVGVVGRPGPGPGEFGSNVFGLDIAGDTALVVRVAGALVRWRLPDLTLLPQIRIGAAYAFQDLRMAKDGFLFSSVSRAVLDRTVRDTNRLLQWEGGTSRVVFEGSSHDKTEAGSESVCFPGVLFAKLFAPTLNWDKRGDVLAVADDDSYTIDVIFDGGRHIRIERAIEPRKVTRDMALRTAAFDEALAWGPPGDKCITTPEQAVRLWGYSEFLQPIGALRLSPAGHIWVLRGRVADEPYAIDILTVAGEYLGTVEGMPMPVAFGPDGRMVVVETNELGVPSVAVYQVRQASGVIPW